MLHGWMQHHCIIIMKAWNHYESLAVWIHLSLLQCFMIDGCLSVLKWRLWGKLFWGHSEFIYFIIVAEKGKKTRDVLLRYLCWPAVIAFYLPPFESVAFRSNRRRFKLSFPQESHHSCSLTSRWNQSWQATSKRCQKWRCRRKSWIHHSLGKIWAHTSFLLSESRNQRKASGGKKGKLVLLHQNVTTITGNLLHSIYTNS